MVVSQLTNNTYSGQVSQGWVLYLPLNSWQARKTADHVLAEIDGLLYDRTDVQTAALVNQRGLKTGAGDSFTSESLRWVREAAGLKSYKERLREVHLLIGLGTRRLTTACCCW